MNITVICGNNEKLNDAEKLAKRLGLSLSDKPGDGLSLVYDTDGLTLSGYGLFYRCDFEALLKRVTGGHIQHEMLLRVAKTKTENPTAIDATAGMGEDSFLLAAAGYNVTLFEKDPVIAALLADGLRRAAENPQLLGITGRMTLIEGDSTEHLSEHTGAELIYLDPMFPARRKSGLVNKKLQLIQHLEQPCVDEKSLFDAAIAAKPHKIIIKRPLKGEFLAGVKPQYSVKGKAIRYDCFVLNQR